MVGFCPAFWDWLIANNAAGARVQRGKVGDEVRPLLMNCRNGRSGDRFSCPDAAVLPSLGRECWATGRHYEPSAVSTLPVADYYLVSHARR